jgi:hypothetical protein
MRSDVFTLFATTSKMYDLRESYWHARFLLCAPLQRLVQTIFYLLNINTYCVAQCCSAGLVTDTLVAALLHLTFLRLSQHRPTLQHAPQPHVSRRTSLPQITIQFTAPITI